MGSFFYLLLFLSVASPALAIKAIDIKDDRVLIDCELDIVKTGQTYYAKNEMGKTMATLIIKKVKNRKAFAQVLSGDFSTDYTLEKTEEVDLMDLKAGRTSSKKSSIGFLLGTSNNSILTQGDSLTGSSPYLAGFYRLKVARNLGAQVSGALEAMQASSSKVCADGKNCNVDISYLGIETSAQYKFINQKSFSMLASLGLGFLFPLSKNSNKIDTSAITINQTFIASIEFDWKLKKNSFIPIQIDYAQFPNSNSASASQLYLKMGYGDSF